ncbi:MAG: hypothetical protein IPJ04_17640 [Candidatus Eisenbacteria bacterium]|nr:hypothetical protein [Candidatus Eisenbacteria bacterium]
MFDYQNWLIEPGNGTLTLTEGADSNLVVSLAVQDRAWAFEFVAPGDRRLTAGDYGTTAWDHDGPSAFARVRITLHGGTMAVPTRLEVRRLRRAPDGGVRSLWVRLAVLPDPLLGLAADSVHPHRCRHGVVRARARRRARARGSTVPRRGEGIFPARRGGLLHVARRPAGRRTRRPR